ncbi:LTA synthase family protein [Paenibacillus thermoaerophilus]|uniref:LTA synthase family protein n=1 Tax=Paenibacillus thermoaerophilus TaxID=1215385 RepID=A0ABW2V453_9BACL|nr:LTA synthase family protein [Paenibacillus thermoaerophilus]
MRRLLPLLKRVPLALVPALLVILLEALSRVSFLRPYEWIGDHPNEWTMNYFIALSLTLLAAGAFGRTRAAYSLLFALVGVLGVASGIKWSRTGYPLFIWDLALPQEGADAAIATNPAFPPHLLPVAGAAALVAGLCLLPRSVRFGWRERAAYGLLGLLLLLSAWRGVPLPLQDYYRTYTIPFEPDRQFERNGVLLSMVTDVDYVRIERPHGTDETSIRRLVGRLQADANRDASAEKPNVIVLLAETFWDPTRLNNVTFSEDPMPFFRSLMKETTSGWILTPQFGGTTANVEFEVLTGNSVRFLPSGSIPYIHYVNREVDSLASILARQGYETTAINPFYNWFFNSRNAYRNMGFSRFVSSEFFEPRYHGPYLEDRQVMEKIIATTAATPGPDFVFANTMENHGGYEDKFFDNRIAVEGPIGEKAKNMLRNYATGVRAFDDAFRYLVDQYRNNPEPTVILCFGDHLPALGDDYAVYKEAGYVTGRNDPDFMDNMHYTPVVIWSNRPGREREELRMNASYLGAYLLRYAGLEGTYYTEYLYKLYREMPLVPPRPFRKTRPVDETPLEDYARLEYDILFGRQYGYRASGLRGRIAPAAFALGEGPVVLKGAEPLGRDGDRLEVRGERFKPDCSVWLNGRKLDTSYRDAGHLYARLPADEAAPPRPWKLQVRLTDAKRTVLARSNELSLAE